MAPSIPPRFRRSPFLLSLAILSTLLMRPLSAQTQYLSDLTWTSATNGWGPVEKDRANGEAGAGDGGAILLNGVTYAKGLGAHALSDIRYAVPAGCTALTTSVGVDDEVGTAGSVIFRILVDGVSQFDSGVMTGSSATQTASVAVSGGSNVALIVDDAGDGNAFDHADWADAKFSCDTTGSLFGTASSYATGTNSHGVAAADLNRDGKLDLVVANAGSSTITVLIGSGTGTFAAGVNYAVGAAPKHVTLADFNGDTFLDAVTSNQDDSTVTLRLGAGNGTFGAPAAFPVCSHAHESVSGDFNGDGKLDLAVACWGGSVLSVLLGTGTGSFQAAVSYTVQSGPNSLAAGDVNGDGKLDLVASNNQSNSVSVLIGSGTGTFAPAVNYASGVAPHGVRVRDLNGDGFLDIVNANNGASDVSVLLGRGDGTFGAAVDYPAGIAPAGIALADVSGDGIIDIIAADTGGNYPVCCNPGGDRIAVLRGTGTGTFAAPEFYIVGTTPFAVAVADLNGDNGLDVATANWDTNNASVLLNTTTGGTRTDTTPPTVTSVTPAASATGVSVSGNITATFSEAMNATTVTSATVTLTPVGSTTAVSAAVTYNSTTFTATLDPSANLAAATQYTARVKGGSTGVKDVAGNALAADFTWTFTTASATTGITYLSDLTWQSATNGWGPVERDMSNGEAGAGDGRPLTLNGTVYAKGLGVHAGSDVRYAVPAGCTTFSAVAGIDAEVGANGSVVMQVWADGLKLFDTATMVSTSVPKSIAVDITGRTQLQLLVNDSGDGTAYDHADWADARFTCSGGTPDTTPPTITARTPAASATGVSLVTNVTVTFSEAMNASTLNTTTVTLTAAGAASPVAATVTYDSASRTVTLDPSASLVASTSYTARVKGGTGGVADLAGNPLATDATWSFTTASATTGTTYLSDLTWQSATNGWGPVERDMSNGEAGAGDGRPLTLNGTVYAKGLGVHAGSDVRYAVPAGCTTFSAVAGIDAEVGANGSVVMQVWADGLKLFDTATMVSTSVPKSIAVDITGRTQLQLLVNDSGDGNAYDHADWADARFSCSGGTPDTTPPTITARTPAAGATGVSLVSNVTVTFSEAMNTSTLNTTTITLTAAGAASPVAATVTYDSASRTVTLDPSASLVASTSYTARVKGGTGGVADLAGNPLATDATWSFTTGTAPTGTLYLSDLAWVSSTNGWGPAERDMSNGEAGAGDGGPLTLNTVVFAKGIGAHAASDIRIDIPAGCTTFDASVGIDDEVTATGSVIFEVWGDTTRLLQTALLRPTSATTPITLDLSGRTQLRLVVTDGGDGNASDHADWANARFTCTGGTTDTTPPTVTAVTPADAATGVGVTTTVTATFSEAMNATTITTTNVTLTAAGSSTAVPASVTYNSATRQVTLDPSGSLASSTAYTARIRGGSTGVADLAGNRLAADKTWTFTTAAPANGIVYISDLTWSSATNGWGPVELDRSNGDSAAGDGGPITVAGVTYAKGLGVHARSDVRYDIPAGCSLFLATVGVDDEVGSAGSVVFQVWADGTKLFDSGVKTGTSAAQTASVSVVGRTQLDLVVEDGGDGQNSDHADWADAKLDCGTRVLSIGDVTVTEGNSGSRLATFPVTLSAASSQVVTVGYATANGTATAGSDYTAASGTLTFPAGVTLQSLSISVIGDTTNEPNETFFVNLANPVNAAIGDGQGLGTISNDDATADTTPPSVTGQSPTPNSAGVSQSATISVSFSESIVGSSGVITVINGDGVTVAGTRAYDSASRTITFTPSAPLQTGSAHTVTVSGMQDTSGNVMPSPVSWSFTTGAPGFHDSAVITGLSNPTVVQFSPDGRVFVAEKSGLIKVFSDLSDKTPTILADLRTNVHNFWDRGLLGMALDPAFPTRPYLYVLYTYDAPIGGTAPTWGTAGVSSDGCPDPNGAGCIVSGRLSRLQVDGEALVGSEHVLIEDWFDEFPSHSIGTVMFGPDGALYVTGGEGASFSVVDYGQVGSPENANGDPPSPVGGSMTPPTAEGGALRAQDVRTTGDPTGLNGSIIRIDPDTGAAKADNPNAASADANARRILGYGFRNPFRFTFRPRANELWIGDVGWSAFEEINVLPLGRSTMTNFGWPCYEGPGRQPAYDAADLTLCEQLYTTPGAVAAPFFTYSTGSPVVAGDPCANGSSSISGLAFYDAGTYPSKYQGSLFFADYSRRCIWVMFPGANGAMDPSTTQPFIVNAAGPVGLYIGPGGDVFYADLDGGAIRRVQYIAGNQSPVARIVASPLTGPTPLVTSFDASTSSDPDPGETLTYAWDLNGDGVFDDGTSPQVSYQYSQPGRYTVSLRVSDSQAASNVATVTVNAGNTPPSVTMSSPVAGSTWIVGQTISFAGQATDAEDGTLPAAALSWSLVMHHCPSACHTHTIQDYPGIASGSFTAPDHEYPSYLELRLTATDSGGLTTTVSRDLQPRTVVLTFASNPSGLQLVVGSTGGTTPFTRTVIINSLNSVSAVSPQSLGTTNYQFSSWSDGGAATHTIVAPATAATYTATFAVMTAGLVQDWTAPRPPAPPGLPGRADERGVVAWLSADQRRKLPVAS